MGLHKELSMSPSAYSFPAPLQKVLSKLPPYPGSVLFVAGLNLALARHLPPDTLRLLDGKKLRIQAKDAGVGFDFIWRDGSFSAARHTGATDLAISASVHDFLLLVQRKEDPDTLFFSRRLIMEGDTELGLLVKNTLDSIDLSVFSPSNLLPARLFGRKAG